MKINILTLFPEMFEGPFNHSIVKRAQKKKLVDLAIHNLRDWAADKHKSVDDRPFGGGAGMLLKVDIIDRALKDLKTKKLKNSKIVLLDAGGKTFDQKMAVNLSKLDNLTLIAGHYEGVDYRVHQHLVNGVISIGNYVLTGGEIAAMVVVDTVVRLIPKVIDPESLKEESFSIKNLNVEYPQYTRPEVYKGWRVPKVLLSGNHKKILEWRKKQK